MNDEVAVLRRKLDDMEREAHDAAQILCAALGYPQWKDCPEVGGQPDDLEYCDFGMPLYQIAAYAASAIQSKEIAHEQK